MEPARRAWMWLHGRGRAIAVIYALLLVGLALFFFSVGPGREAARLGQSLPELLTRVSSGAIAGDIGREHGWSRATQEKLRKFVTTNSDEIKSYAERFGMRAAGVAKQAWLILLVPLLATS